MNIENYRTFQVLAITESFVKTAEHMNVAQSTVSSRINELEKFLDTKLFERSKWKVKITNAGKLLVPYANNMIANENEAISHIKSAGNFEDCIRINVSGGLYREKIAPIVDKFYNLYPQYSLDIRFNKPSVQLEILFENDGDIGFTYIAHSSQKIEVIPYLEYEWILIANPDYDIPTKINVSELTSLNFSFFHLNTELEKWLLDALPKSFKPRININSIAQLIEYVKKGYGCAFIPSYSVKEDLEAGIFKEIKINNLKPKKFYNYIAVNKKRENADVVKKFLNLIPEVYNNR
ncbi:LysR family transcriptional regulator [Oceanirhabdus sp. W0125-5]|uniref:LysR family transcriptional regulator n=1 Tax=Oceanirhabdus sp. W0125-5 TaxID=2999116 RepID=UPI0022F2C993|nr:LysR family transcriptional regulator [Oceanirhabdus sp. W0125-5]WBW97040.1 LysR family transcriptional regulator [Oceanirhabdus sp. W0125-5]